MNVKELILSQPAADIANLEQVFIITQYDGTNRILIGKVYGSSSIIGERPILVFARRESKQHNQ